MNASTIPRNRRVQRSSAPGLSELVRNRRVVVCCGTGGVGKTTTAAALALGAARTGRRVVVVTIDPARRLADALGLAALGTEPCRVNLPPGYAGELWAMMLDARGSFDALVTREALSPAQASRILSNRFYRNIADSLSGTQEYMAVEVLHDLVSGNGAFDLVVVDTPPTRNALEFLDVPRRLTRLLDNAVFRTLMRPTRAGFKVVGAATNVLLRSIDKVVGGEVVAEAVAFFQAFEGMEEGFRRRALATLAVLELPTTAWVLVTSGRADAIDEALFFANQLEERGHHVDAIVANRLSPRFVPVPPAASASGRHRAADPAARATLESLWAAAIAQNARADAEDLALAPLIARANGVHGRVPARADDIHDLAGVSEVADLLVGRPG